MHHYVRVSCMQGYCLTISAAASLLSLGLVHISTARAVIYGEGSVTAFNDGVGGTLTLSSWGGPQSVSELGKQLTVCPGLSQPDVLDKAVNLPPMSPSPASADGQWLRSCLRRAPGRGVNQNHQLPPRRGHCFLLWFLPVAKTDDVTAHL